MSELEPEYFFFKLPIYKSVTITEENVGHLNVLFQFGTHSMNDVTVEGYNPNIKQKSTFGGWANGATGDHFMTYGGVEKISIKCRRNGDIFSFFIFYDPENNKMMKVGQYPSIADLQIQEVKKYNKVLSPEKLKEFTKGIGLAANGVGIGSFVYMRRIFEHLIFEGFKENVDELKMQEKDFRVLRMEEKILLLKDYLPQFLVENSKFYSILSLGVHALDEEECLSYFGVIKLGIEIMLDQKLEQKLKKQKELEAKQKLNELHLKLKKKE
jgi:hypothetical protein